MESVSVYAGYAGFISQFAQEIEESCGWEHEAQAKISTGFLKAAGFDSDDITGAEEITAEFVNESLSRLSRRHIETIPLRVVLAASLGHTSSLLCLGARLALRAEDTVDLTQQTNLTDDAVWLFSRAAEEGDAKAQWAMGERFCQMRHGLEEGLRLLGKAAAQSFPQAEKRLTELYTGRFSFVTMASEIKWLRCYAEAGISDAKFELAAHLYISGDSKAAFRWMLKAAQEGHAKAQERLAFFYELGEGCRRDPHQSRHWRDKCRAPVEICAAAFPETELFPEFADDPVQAEFSFEMVLAAETDTTGHDRESGSSLAEEIAVEETPGSGTDESEEPLVETALPVEEQPAPVPEVKEPEVPVPLLKSLMRKLFRRFRMNNKS